MLWTKFVGLDPQLAVDLPEEYYGFTDIVDITTKLDERFSLEGSIYELHYKIYSQLQTEAPLIETYEGSYMLGANKGHLMLDTKNKLNEFKDFLEDEQRMFLEELTTLLEQTEAMVEAPEVLDEAYTVQEKFAPVEEDVAQKGSIMQKQKRNRKSHTFQFPWKRVGIAFGAILAIFIVSVGVALLVKYVTTEASEEPIQTFDAFMESKAYEKAAEAYPKKIQEIEGLLFQENDEEALQAFQTKYPTQEGKLDLAFIQKDYASVMAIYEEKKEIQMTNQRIAMVGYSALKTGNLAQAKEMNKRVQSDLLTQKIADYELLESTKRNLQNQWKVEKDLPRKKELQANIEAIEKKQKAI
ncbi:hypothetical protein [Listeria booriae]|uniref:hypothetical protein n=1 Tax=Listeria booriae TaxID=1552123 RepID=UPI001629A2AC|nr:hypothetical protein [Listeria booriae]MBC2305843.1 hypothetical protein [Listeria booriae]